MGQHGIVAMAHARIKNCTIFNDNLITLFVMEMRMPITRNDVVLPEMIEPNFRPFCHRKNVIAQKLLTTENRFEFEKNTQNYTYRFIFSLLFSRNWFFCSVSRAPAGLKVLTQKKKIVSTCN